jgi:hypothetical protein
MTLLFGIVNYCVLPVQQQVETMLRFRITFKEDENPVNELRFWGREVGYITRWDMCYCATQCRR